MQKLLQLTSAAPSTPAPTGDAAADAAGSSSAGTPPATETKAVRVLSLKVLCGSAEPRSRALSRGYALGDTPQPLCSFLLPFFSELQNPAKNAAGQVLGRRKNGQLVRPERNRASAMAVVGSFHDEFTSCTCFTSRPSNFSFIYLPRVVEIYMTCPSKCAEGARQDLGAEASVARAARGNEREATRVE